MPIKAIAESFPLASAYTSGLLHKRLNDSVRQRYRRPGAQQDSYELVIDNNRALKVKRADKDGQIISLAERLRYGPFVRVAVITNQSLITSLLPSLIPLTDDRLTETDRWHLLTYSIEWKVESSEDFYRHFLRHRTTVSEWDVLATIAGAIRQEYLHYLHEANSSAAEPLPVEPLDHTTLTEAVLPQINRRIAYTGIAIRRFYRTIMGELQSTITNQPDAQTIGAALFALRHQRRLLSRGHDDLAALHSILVSGLLSYFCQGINSEQQWLVHIWRICGFDLTFDEVCAALTTPSPVWQLPAAANRRHLGCFGGWHRRQGVEAAFASPLQPLTVVERLHYAGRQQLRAANRTAPAALQRRNDLRRQALSFFAFALLLNDAPICLESDVAFTRSMRVELLALVESLHDREQHGRATLTFPPGSVVHLMAVTVEANGAPQENESTAEPTLRFVQEILPLTTPSGADVSVPVTVWTPEAAAKQVAFIGAETEIDLLLQVLEPSTATTDSETMAAVLFWRWRVRATCEQFSLRLRPTAVPMVHEVEVQAAELIDWQPVRSAQFPAVPHLRLTYEPLELALLLDGYWLAAGSSAQPQRRTGLSLLIELLDGLDAIENLTKRGLLIHAAICLDEHIAQDFLAAYSPLPCLYTLGDAPIETTAQLVAEWLQPWVDRWNGWAIKPYPVDTDIALEKGVHYLRHLQWQQTTHPAQRAILAIGRSRPHDHAKYFVTGTTPEPRYPKQILDRLTIPYDPEDRFSVTDIDWRADFSSLRQSVGTILALCDPGLPNPQYRLPANHVLFREYQEFWATVDPGTRLDVRDEDLTPCAEMGIDRVLQTLDAQLFQRRAVYACEPALTLPLAQILTTGKQKQVDRS
jgi:hypothetical protein